MPAAPRAPLLLLALALATAAWAQAEWPVKPLRLVIPAWSNEPISLLKSSAIAFLIAVPDLMARAKIVAAKTYDPIGAYTAVSVVYLVMVLVLGVALKYMERRSKIPGLGMEGRA